MDAWRDEHGVEDIDIVAIVARKGVNAAGGGTVIGWGTLGARRLLIEDNAWSLPRSPINNSAVDDAADKLLGHETGHTMPTDAPSGSTTGGLRHVCATEQGGQDDNLMRQGHRDLTGDNVLDNFNLSNSVAEVTNDGADGEECTADDTTETVDQIALLQAAT